MADTKSQIFLAENFKGEREINNFFEKYLSNIFPNLIHIQSEWQIPDHDPGDNDSKVDALAFWRKNKKDKEIKPVILEYKCKNDKNPIHQILRYYRILWSKSNSNYIDFKDVFKEKFPKIKIEWNNEKAKKEKFLKNTILICIIDRSSFYKVGANELVKADDDNICLIEVRKYENKEDKFILISLINRDKKNRQQWKELLGIKKKSLIIQIPKSEKWVDNKTFEAKKEVKKKINNDKIENKETNLEAFLSQNNKTDEKIKEKVRILDKKIKQILKNSLEKSEAIQPKKGGIHRLFCYYKLGNIKNSQLLYIRPIGKGWEVILEDNQTTAEFPIRNFVGGSATTPKTSFIRYFIIQNKDDYKKFNLILKDYLKKIKERT
ncbi:MAG: hypothetical protein I3273_04770 [Candidatus Moeniiplasma glomeromycotorum]|nr:hypothetical protein [Candidatus Moeniiplasma glomeromycotorum]MCE8168328.1 hypothetical protein [Candidatus Moeniiplasma glomeromycotorum]MCE8169404.1 hypothetical protein [Candidatus Moeniiplasma glomeromycotorum]